MTGIFKINAVLFGLITLVSSLVKASSDTYTGDYKLFVVAMIMCCIISVLLSLGFEIYNHFQLRKVRKEVEQKKYTLKTFNPLSRSDRITDMRCVQKVVNDEERTITLIQKAFKKSTENMLDLNALNSLKIKLVQDFLNKMLSVIFVWFIAFSLYASVTSLSTEFHAFITVAYCVFVFSVIITLFVAGCAQFYRFFCLVATIQYLLMNFAEDGSTVFELDGQVVDGKEALASGARFEKESGGVIYLCRR